MFENIPTKTCTKCGQALPATEAHFRKHKGYKYGVRSRCRTCEQEDRKQNRAKESARWAAWAARNREHVRKYHREAQRRRRGGGPRKSAQSVEERRAKQRKYYRRNRERISAVSKAYREANCDAVRARSREYYEKNRDEINEKNRRYARRHREAAAERLARWREKHPDRYRELVRVGVRNRRCRERGAGPGISGEEWAHALDFFGQACGYCGAEGALHIEHIEPIARGGPNSADNVLPACPPCNRAKGSQPLWEWWPGQPFFSVARAVQIVRFFEAL